MRLVNVMPETSVIFDTIHLPPVNVNGEQFLVKTTNLDPVYLPIDAPSSTLILKHLPDR
jgi:hypothetical protein